MTFYDYRDLLNYNNGTNWTQYLVLAITLLAIITSGFLWFRHRTNLKYRDLLLIAVLALLFIVGKQTSDWQDYQATRSQKDQTIAILETTAKELNTTPQQLETNQQEAKNGMLIRYEHTYYRVDMADDNSSFSLVPTHVIT